MLYSPLMSKYKAACTRMSVTYISRITIPVIIVFRHKTNFNRLVGREGDRSKGQKNFP